MNKVKELVKAMQEDNFENEEIAEALCDGEFLKEVGIGDEDQHDVEDEYNRLMEEII